MICLVMIVKNEENVIERSLRSAFASPLVTSWCIVDTGSTDKTIEIIHKVAADCKRGGWLYERPWVNFAVNRTEALQLATSACADDKGKWLFMLDADDTLCGTFPDNLDPAVDGYTIPLRLSNIKYRRTLLFNTSKPWIYKFPVHEYPYLENSVTKHIPSKEEDLYIQCRSGEGARSKNPNKYVDDALLLEKEYELKNENITRAAFYAAQSWRDAGFPDKAVHWFIIRLSLCGWKEEQYICYLNIMRGSKAEPATMLIYAWKALSLCPNRKEVTHCLLEKFRKMKFWSTEAYALALISYNNKTQPSDSLFLEQDIYDYKFNDEFSIYAYYMGYDKEALEAAEAALIKAEGDAAASIRIAENIRLMSSSHTEHQKCLRV
jgi:glycosyltransferase involved in cell wall biosynthesis